MRRTDLRQTLHNFFRFWLQMRRMQKVMRFSWLLLMGELSPKVTEGEKTMPQNLQACINRQVRYLSIRRRDKSRCHLPRQRKAGAAFHILLQSEVKPLTLSTS